MSKLGVVIQARMGSTRLPGKVLKEVMGRPLFDYMLERLSRAKKIDRLIAAVPKGEADEQIVALARSRGVEVFTGSEEDVLDRYYRAAKDAGLDLIVRITADCPLLDAPTLDNFVDSFYARPGLDYLGTGPTFPEGYDMEVFTAAALETAWLRATKKSDREHVTSYIRAHPELFSVAYLDWPQGDLSWLRITVDEPADFQVVGEIIEKLSPENADFDIEAILALFRREPELLELNRHIKRNQGYERSLLEEAGEGRL